FIADGYASHLSQLEYNQRSRPAKTGSTRMVLRKGSFGLGGSGDFLRKRNHLLRTISSQPTTSRTRSEPIGVRPRAGRTCPEEHEHRCRLLGPNQQTRGRSPESEIGSTHGVQNSGGTSFWRL
ncbi:hypothetical protein M9458_022604, partial [Cirrhinus mrigala]